MFIRLATGQFILKPFLIAHIGRGSKCWDEYLRPEVAGWRLLWLKLNGRTVEFSLSNIVTLFTDYLSSPYLGTVKYINDIYSLGQIR